MKGLARCLPFKHIPKGTYMACTYTFYTCRVSLATFAASHQLMSFLTFYNNYTGLLLDFQSSKMLWVSYIVVRLLHPFIASFATLYFKVASLLLRRTFFNTHPYYARPANIYRPLVSSSCAHFTTLLHNKPDV